MQGGIIRQQSEERLYDKGREYKNQNDPFIHFRLEASEEDLSG